MAGVLLDLIEIIEDSADDKESESRYSLMIS
jgi:hypothetical protein